MKNNFKIHDISAEVKDDLSEEKIIDIFSQLNICISKSDIEDCHWLGKSNLIVRFINQKFSADSGEKFEIKKLIDNSKLGLHVKSKLINSL